ncbi:hypothetical protein MKX08_003813 [Trichoderma sp. CBMAI-0020]|nr:hypothetical protein MKX08_003813 [Trichoderma sp. CBMAI-0020]
MRFSILAIIPLAAAAALEPRVESNEDLEARGTQGQKQEAIAECNAARAKCYMSSWENSEFATCIEEWQVCIDSASEDSPYCCKYPDGNDLPGFGTHN